MRLGIAPLSLALLLTASAVLTAQDTTEAAERPPLFSTGVIAGGIRFAGGRTEQAANVLLQLQPMPWLLFSASPGYGRTSFGTTSNTGLTNIPLTAGAMYTANDLPWSPAMSASFSSAISSGDSAMVVGTAAGVWEGELAVTGAPTDRLNLQVGWSRPLSTYSGNSSMRVESSLELGRSTATLGLSSELGRPDSGTALARSIGGGVAFSLVGPLTLTADGSHGISGSAPSWTFSLGIGTAFAGVSPLNPTSALKRLKQTFGSKVSGSSGYSNRGGSGNCKKTGTC